MQVRDLCKDPMGTVLYDWPRTDVRAATGIASDLVDCGWVVLRDCSLTVLDLVQIQRPLGIKLRAELKYRWWVVLGSRFPDRQQKAKRKRAHVSSCRIEFVVRRAKHHNPVDDATAPVRSLCKNPSPIAGWRLVVVVAALIAGTLHCPLKSKRRASATTHNPTVSPVESQPRFLTSISPSSRVSLHTHTSVIGFRSASGRDSASLSYPRRGLHAR